MTPLAASLRTVLREFGALTPAALGKRLRRRAPAAIPLDALERELRGNRELFRPLGDGRWDLAERVDPEPAADDLQGYVPIDPMIGGGLFTDFVVIDLETTGTQPGRDEIIQLAAVRFRSGRPVAALNRHVAPDATAVPEPLRVRMGWDEIDPSCTVVLNEALEALAMFLGADPPLAWNAAFEHDFLEAASFTFPSMIDSLAVAVLARPRGPHRLEHLVQGLGLEPEEQLAACPVDGPRPATAHAHDALYDCVAAGLVHAVMVEELAQGVGPAVAALLPELELSDRCRTPRPTPEPTVQSLSPGNAEDVLTSIVLAMGRDRRPQQAEAARLVERALEGSSAVVEAPTGTGKTLAYLAAAIARVELGGRVALVTAYKNLQDQLLDEFAAAASAAGIPTTLAILKGADNYLCRQRLNRLAVDLATGPVEHRYVAAVLHRLLSTEDKPTRDDVSWWLISRFPASVAILDAVAVGCAHAECGRQEAIRAANEAQLVVMNQVLWLAPPDGLEVPSTVVIDEAHDLESMATLAFTEEVGSAQLRAIANRLAPAGRPGILSAVRHAGADTAAATHLVRRLRSATRQCRVPFARFAAAISPDVDIADGGTTRLRRNPATLHPGAWTRAADAIRDLADTMTELSAALANLGNAVPDRLLSEDVNDLARSTWDLVDLLRRLTAVQDASAVYYLEVGNEVEGTWRLARSPIDVAPLLRPRWAQLDGFVLISATLQNAASDFSFIVDRLGLRGLLPGGVHVVESDFPFNTNVVLGIARWFDSIPVPRFMDEFEAECADEISSLAEVGDGRLLGLFTSRARVGRAYDAVAERLAAKSIPVLAQGHGARQALLDEFRTRVESVLLGTRSFWQGVDVPGEALSFVAIEKLPFPHLRDPITEARLESIRRGSGNEFEAYLLPAMTITFKQGFGRLLRGPTDRGAVIILDRRFHTKGYRETVLSSLPGFVPRDPEAELSRRRFYERLALTLPELISAVGMSRLEAMPTGRRTMPALPDVPTTGSRDARRPMVLGALRQLFGFGDFRRVEQEELFWAIHDGCDVIGLLPTGAGKSLPFQLSALTAPGTTLVVSPLIALMRDQVEQLLDKGIREVGALVGQMSADERDEVLRRVEVGTIRLLYVSPERLRDPVFRDRLSRLPLRRVVVDEAHCVSLWGPSFRPDFLAVRSSLDCAGHTSVPIAALTATATPEIEDDIRSSLRLEGARKIATPFGRRELRLGVIGNNPRVAGERISNDKDRVRTLIRILTAAERRSEAAIVYVATVASAEQLTTQLQHSGIVARAYHGRLDAWARQNVEELFRDSEVDVVVATKAFGMGIDRADVRYVIHVGFPADLESYYQEAGRAGRDRAPSWCLLIPLPERDRRTQSWFIEQVRSLDGPIGDVHAELRDLGPGRHLVELSRIAESTGLDESQARIVLHHLEAAGVLRRGTDQTVEASVLCLRPPDNVLVRLIFARFGVEPMVSARLDLAEAADRVGEDIAAVESALLSAARSGDVVYRPFRRKAMIDVTPDVVVTAPDTSVVTSRMYTKLDAMVDYAIDRRMCRQMTIRSYLGESAPTPCGACDVCDPDFPRPWLDVPLDEVPVPDRLLDPEIVCLYAIGWNEAEVATGRAPYGRSALELLLAGDSFSLGRYVQGGERARRVRRAQASPYWAALQLLTNPLPKIKATVSRLVSDEEVTTAPYEIRGGSPDGPTQYAYLVLTDLGRSHLNRDLRLP